MKWYSSQEEGESPSLIVVVGTIFFFGFMLLITSPLWIGILGALWGLFFEAPHTGMKTALDLLEW